MRLATNDVPSVFTSSRGSATAWRCRVDTCSHVQFCSHEPPLSALCRWRHRDHVPSPSAWLIVHRPSGLCSRPWRVVVKCHSRWILFSRHSISVHLSSSEIRFPIRRPTDEWQRFDDPRLRNWRRSVCHRHIRGFEFHVPGRDHHCICGKSETDKQNWHFRLFH